MPTPRRTPPAPRRAYRITRVYTRSGDDGTTGLVGGHRVSKDHPRLEAVGAIDELQVAVGAARAELQALAGAVPIAARLEAYLHYLQHRLFTAGGEMATRREDRVPQMPTIRPRDVRWLESLIDRLNATLPPLEDFVLPGGHRAVVALHQCRVVCRRAERAAQHLAQTEPIGAHLRPFLNRLSDALFVMARALDQALRTAGLAPPETIWQRNPKPPRLPRRPE